MKYIEFGWGNTWLLRTEFESRDGTEYEVKGIVGKIQPQTYYLRLWLGRTVYILDSREGFKTTNKNHKTFKFILGIRSKAGDIERKADHHGKK